MALKSACIFACVVLAAAVTTAKPAHAVECHRDVEAPLPVIEAACGAIINTPLASDEDKARAFRRRGYARMYDAGRPQDGYADFTAALALGPTVSAAMRSQIYRLRSEASNLLNNLSSAFNDVNAAIETDPGNAEAHTQLARLHRRTSNPSLAMASLDAAVRIDGTHVVARLDRAKMNSKMELFERVVDDTAVVLAQSRDRLDRRYPDRSGRMVTQRIAAVELHTAALGRLNRRGEAEALFVELIRDQPIAEVYRARADFYFYAPIQADSFDKARDDYQAAIKLAPDDHASWHGFAATLARTKRLDEALTAISIAIDRLPTHNNWAAVYNWEKASILRQSGRVDDAVSTIASAWSAHVAVGDYHHIEHYLSILRRSGFLTGRNIDVANPTSRPIAAAIAGCMRNPVCS